MRSLGLLAVLVLLAPDARAQGPLSRLLRHAVAGGTVPDGGGGSLQAHPRLWLDSAHLSLLSTKAGASDADWLAVVSAADALLSQTVPMLTITAATNANPVVFTATETIPWTSAISTVYLSGASGLWTGVNNGNTAGVAPWTATKTGTHTFSIPVNSTAFGSFSGQNIALFMNEGEDSGFIHFGYEGQSWIEAFTYLGLAYKVTGTTTYSNKAKELFDYINFMASRSMIALVTGDGGRFDNGVTSSFALARDWFDPVLSGGQKTAAATTVNFFNDWTVANAFAIDDPTSNYWELHNIAIASSAYATCDENARCDEWLDWADTNWTTHFAPLFLAPSTTVPTHDTDQGYYYGGLAVVGFNYGGRDIARHAKYMMLVKSAMGSYPTNAVAYGQTFARNLIHQLKPDRWKTTNWGVWSADTYGVMQFDAAMFLSDLLAGTTEGAWMQYFYDHQGSRPSGDDAFALPNLYDKVLFYNSARTATDYTATQPTSFFSAGGEAIVTTRSDWTTSGTYAFFNASSSHFPDTAPKFAGHVDLTRGTDYLLVQANYWHGTDDGSSGSPQLNIAGAAAYANTLFFSRAADGLGPDGFSHDDSYDGGQIGPLALYTTPIVKFDTTAYAEGQFETMYDYTGTKASAEVQYFIRDFASLGDGLYAVWDRIQSSASNDVKELRWHLSSDNAPTNVAGVVKSVAGSSAVFIVPVLPATSSITTAQVSSLPYRATVTNPTPTNQLNALTLFALTASGGSAPEATVLDSDANVTALQSGAHVAVFPVNVTSAGSGNYSPTRNDGCAFVSTHSGTGVYVVGGLAAHAYDVKVGGSAVGTYTVDSTGVLNFSSTAGIITVTQ